MVMLIFHYLSNLGMFSIKILDHIYYLRLSKEEISYFLFQSTVIECNLVSTESRVT